MRCQECDISRKGHYTPFYDKVIKLFFHPEGNAFLNTYINLCEKMN